jgi:two-component system response regulator HydG
MAETAFILIVEDEAAHGEVIKEGLERAGHACNVVESGQAAVQSIRKRAPDVVITDYRLGGDMDGMDVLKAAKQASAVTEVILVTAHGNEALARAALRPDNPTRAYDYITKPLDIEEVRAVVERAARQAATSRENAALRAQLDQAFSFEGILGGSEAMAGVIKRLKLVAGSKITVLITGETGTGKDLVAQAIHNNSPRKSRDYRVINCAGLSETLLESELFGHVKGAYTGALNDRKGLFEVADGGTLFLDEVGDMPLVMQAKLLRAVDKGEIIPVGSNDPRRVDVRVIAATHRNLQQRVSDGAFREDLFYRLNQVPIGIPALRERREDIPLLVDHFIKQASRRHDKHVNAITPASVRKLTQHPWKGNVRELENTITTMVVLCESDTLDVADLPEAIRGSTELVPVQSGTTAGLSMNDMEKIHIANTLRHTDGNRERAAKILGIGARTLYRKLKEYELS